jgi:hypothetical protein
MLRLALFVLYLLVVTPLGLAARTVRGPLARLGQRQPVSYWVQP